MNMEIKKDRCSFVNLTRNEPMVMSLDAINQRIKDLESKKKDLELRDSKKLYKSTQQILGDKFSTSLATHIISESWKAASRDQKDRWLKAANSFQKPKPFNKANPKPRNETKADAPKTI